MNERKLVLSPSNCKQDVVCNQRSEDVEAQASSRTDSGLLGGLFLHTKSEAMTRKEKCNAFFLSKIHCHEDSDLCQAWFTSSL